MAWLSRWRGWRGRKTISWRGAEACSLEVSESPLPSKLLKAFVPIATNCFDIQRRDDSVR